MSQSAKKHRAIILALRPHPLKYYIAYYFFLVLFLSTVFVAGRNNSMLHLVAGGFFLGVLGMGAIALISDLARDFFLDVTLVRTRRVTGIVLAALAFALACGLLETVIPNSEQLGKSAKLNDVAELYVQGVTAKALSSLVGALGFASILSALTAELTGGWKFTYKLTPTEYVVVKEKTENSMNGYLKHVYFINLEGREKCVTTNLSLTNSVLADSRTLAAQVSVGNRIQVIESGEYRAIVGITSASLPV